MGDFCFRLLDLRSAIKSGEITDPRAILEAAAGLDSDLEAWRASVPLNWNYTTVDAGNAPPGPYFDGKRHIYSSQVIAQIWNNWRTLRILVNRLIFENEVRSGVPDSGHESAALSVIQKLSTEICVTIPIFSGARKYTEILNR